MDPTNATRLWLGGQFLYRTTDGAGLWTKASTAMPDGALVSAIAVSPADGNRVVAGTNAGDLASTSRALTATASTTWDVRRPRDGWVTSVTYDRRNPRVLYATYGNFGGAHVFRSTNDGATWQSLDGYPDADGLPDVPVHCLVVDPDDSERLYLATDVGVFVSVDGGRRWMAEETGFGPAVTEWLALTRGDAGEKLLFAFTHGRGAWRVEIK
jgi:hypothetical protein